MSYNFIVESIFYSLTEDMISAVNVKEAGFLVRNT